MKLTPTQQRFVAILGKRYLFVFDHDHFVVGHKDNGYRHGHYDYDRDKALKAARVTSATVRALRENGTLEDVTWFRRPGTLVGRSYICRIAKRKSGSEARNG